MGSKVIGREVGVDRLSEVTPLWRAMAWAVWLVLWALGVRGCLHCDPDTMRLVQELKGPYLDRQVPEVREQLRALLDRSLQELSWDLPIGPKTYVGIIDDKTMAEAAAYFRRAMTRIMENDLKDEHLFNEMMWSLQELRVTFEKLMAQFQKEVPFPNKCGLMVQQFIDCRACGYKLYSHSRGLHCGERKLQVQEDEDLILDCALTWHQASYGVKSYRFYRVLGGSERIMVTGSDAFLVKKEVTVNDSGRYRCEMLNMTGFACSILDFQVTVIPLQRKSTSSPVPPLLVSLGTLTLLPLTRDPTLPRSPGNWTVWVIIGASTGLILLLVGGCTWLYRGQQGPEEEDESQEKLLKM